VKVAAEHSKHAQRYVICDKAGVGAASMKCSGCKRKIPRYYSTAHNVGDVVHTKSHEQMSLISTY